MENPLPMTERTLLIRDADAVATMDDERRELRRASVLLRGRVVEAIERQPVGAVP